MHIANVDACQPTIVQHRMYCCIWTRQTVLSSRPHVSELTIKHQTKPARWIIWDGQYCYCFVNWILSSLRMTCAFPLRHAAETPFPGQTQIAGNDWHMWEMIVQLNSELFKAPQQKTPCQKPRTVLSPCCGCWHRCLLEMSKCYHKWGINLAFMSAKFGAISKMSLIVH